MPISKSIRQIYPGMGSPGSSGFSMQNAAAAASAATLVCPLPQPLSHGLVRIKTEAAVASFQVTSITGKDASAAVYILFAGEPALAMAGINDRYFHFNSDVPLVEIDIGILPGAATTISYEVVGGA